MRTRNPQKLIMIVSLIMQLIMSCLVFQCAVAAAALAVAAAPNHFFSCWMLWTLPLKSQSTHTAPSKADLHLPPLQHRLPCVRVCTNRAHHAI